MDDEIEELRRQTEKGDRIDERTGSDGGDLADDILDTLQEQENPTVSVWWPPFAALVEVMEERPEVRERLAAALGMDEPESAERSDILKAIIRTRIRDVDPDLWDEVTDAYGTYKIEAGE